MAVKNWKEKEKCIKRAVNCQKQVEGWGWGSEDYTYPRSLLFHESPFAQQQSSWLVRLSSSCQSQAKCVVWTLNCSCGKMQTMTNSVNGEVVSFDSAFEEAPRCLSKFDMSLKIWYVSHLRIGIKRSNFFTDFWKESTACVANCLWEKPDIIFWSSGVGSHERNFDGETFQAYLTKILSL